MTRLFLKDGIWHTHNDRAIDYPKEGHANCFQVEDNSYWFKNRNALILDTVQDLYKNHEISKIRILDVGGGNGFVSKGFQDLGYDITLLEPGEGAFNARSRGIRQIYKCTMDELPKDLLYDAIGFFDVLEHLQNPTLTLHQALRALKPGGLILATVPAYQFLYSEDDSYAGHYTRYNLKKLSSVFAKADLKVIYHTYFFSPLLIPILIFRTLPYRLRRFRSQSQTASVKDAAKDHLPSKTIATLLNFIFTLERKYIHTISRLPFGASLFVVAERSSRSNT